MSDDTRLYEVEMLTKEGVRVIQIERAYSPTDAVMQGVMNVCVTHKGAQFVRVGPAIDRTAGSVDS